MKGNQKRKNGGIIGDEDRVKGKGRGIDTGEGKGYPTGERIAESGKGRDCRRGEEKGGCRGGE